MGDREFAAQRVAELTQYILEIAMCDKRSKDRKSLILVSAMKLRDYWLEKYYKYD